MTNGISANETLVWRLQFAYKNPHREHLLMEAADEIERLRADRNLWRHRAEEYFYTDPDCECPLCDQVREAINGNR